MKESNQSLPLVVTFAVAALAILLSGCVSPSTRSVPATAVGTSQTVEPGTVVDTRTVVINGTATHAGSVGGSVVGGAVGSSVGTGTGSILTGAVGVAAGAVIGPMVEKALSKKAAQEITIQLDDGGMVVVVQEWEEPAFQQGDRVSVLEGRTGYSRVRHEVFGTEFFSASVASR